ncbi:MAG: ATP-binding protein [Planctomycetia bacterium]|nr:ATP-binding protein [Planctomycetia bacterium]
MAWLWGILLGLVAGFVAAAVIAAISRRDTEKTHAIYYLLQRHFQPTPVGELRVATRQFPMRMRADVQRGFDAMFGGELTVARLMGVKYEHEYFQGIELAHLLTGTQVATQVPVQYEEVNIGEAAPVRVQDSSLWLVHGKQRPGAILLSRVRSMHGPGTVRVDVAAPNDGPGGELIQAVYARIEELVRLAPSYRGKILSLEASDEYSGEGTGLKVHTLAPVAREEVILPDETLALLDRNVINFVGRRARLSELGQSKKKGLLLFGPPGVGKTHTIRYLSTSMPGQTTLLMTGEQVGMLAEYMSLARLLQPSIVVIEDVDLIARSREQHDGPCTEVMLNKLLNEMDGLKDDAEILFILTTNRPQDLEEALAARPGRIDQAIEFACPDEEGRRKLAQLYGRRVKLPVDVEELLVAQSEGGSGAFIKELIRRSVQFQMERADDGVIATEDVQAALDELLRRGGEVNARSLGAPLGLRGRLGF